MNAKRNIFRSIPINAVVFAGLMVGIVVAARNNGKDKPIARFSEPVAAASFAIVELFTSEGCSSCPPAERLLNELVDQARKENTRVFPLAFHVDYWNRLGWSDRFSKKDYSTRQRRYADAFGANRIYTPQMAVNGGAEFVGSDRRRARAAIEEALAESDAIPLDLRLRETKGGVEASYEIRAKNLRRYRLNLAIVERGLVTQVHAGENNGRTLQHENVVRAFRTVRPRSDGRGSCDITLDKTVNRKKASAIAYLQRESDWKIVGAAQSDLTPTNPANAKQVPSNLGREKAKKRVRSDSN
jgi:hypothetical protein